MIPPLPEWSFEWRGDAIWLRPRDRPASCAISYVERLQPSASFGKLLTETLAATPLGAPVLRAIEEGVTAEGELSCVATIDCMLDGRCEPFALSAKYARRNAPAT